MQYLTERPNRVPGGLLDVPRTVDDLLNRFWGGPAQPRVGAGWRLAVDIIDTPQAYILRAELPGVNPDDIDVTMAGDTLTIRGEKMVEETHDGESWCLGERQAGRFERSFTFPTPVSPESIEAESRHGILAVKVTKAKEAQPHKISIRTS